MPQTVNLIQDKVASFELVHPLDLPATVREQEPVCILLDENFLSGFLLQRFHIFVIYNGKLEALNLLKLSCLILGQLIHINSTKFPVKLNIVTPVHPVDLELQKVWLGW